MGYSLSLLGMQTAESDSALAASGFARTGEKAEYARKPLAGYALPGNWYLVVATRCDADFIRPGTLERLSQLYPVVACSIEEHVMFSAAEYWAGGARVWRAEHVGESGPIHLKTEGRLPEDFAAMAAAQYAMQEADGGETAGVDHYFDIPLNAARGVFGFKHDEDIPGVDYQSFDVLQRIGVKGERRRGGASGNNA